MKMLYMKSLNNRSFVQNIGHFDDELILDALQLLKCQKMYNKNNCAYTKYRYNHDKMCA